MRLCPLVIALAVAATLAVGAEPVRANEVAGATYVGKISVGGTIKFTVSRDGTAITRLVVTYLASDKCTDLTGLEWNFSGRQVPIVDHAFSFESSGTPYGIVFTGSFPTPGTAKGTLLDDSRHCSAKMGWSAAVARKDENPPDEDEIPPSAKDEIPPNISVPVGPLVLQAEKTVMVPVRCPAAEARGCYGDVLVRARTRNLVLGARSFRAAAGKTADVTVTLYRRGFSFVVGKKVRVSVIVKARDVAGNEKVVTRVVSLNARLPDLVVAFAPVAMEGQRCYTAGEIVEVRFRVKVRNRGPGNAPNRLAVRTGGHLTTVLLPRELAPGPAVASDLIVDGDTTVVVDPQHRVRESNEKNNAATSPYRRLRCGPV